MQIVKKEKAYQFLDKDGKDFVDVMKVLNMSIEADALKTKCTLTVLDPIIDIKIDEVEIKHDLLKYIKHCSLEELENLRLEIEKILDTGQGNEK